MMISLSLLRIRGQLISANLKHPDREYAAPAFGFFRLPFKYDETGVRDLMQGPILFRATAQLAIDRGQYRLVIRSRNDANTIYRRPAGCYGGRL